jgi:hypothetical protein
MADDFGRRQAVVCQSFEENFEMNSSNSKQLYSFNDCLFRPFVFTTTLFPDLLTAFPLPQSVTPCCPPSPRAFRHTLL